VSGLTVIPFIFKICFSTSFLATLLIFMSPLSVASDHEFDLSGFGRLVTGAIDDDELVFAGYDNNFSFEEQSLIAFRGEYTYANTLSVVGQVIGHSSDTRDSGIQWLYARYQATNNLSLMLGRQRVPIFTYSDVIDVGFAYDWISPPTQIYTNYLFSEFDGITTRYNFATSLLNGSFDAYYGRYDGDIRTAGVRTKVDAKKVYGLVGEIQWSDFTFSAAVSIGDVKVPNDQLSGFRDTLSSLSFNQSADALIIDGSAKFSKVGISYEKMDYYVRSEITNISSNINLVPSVDSAYISAGYRFPTFLIHATIATSDSEYDEFPDEIPFGLNPQLDALYFGYQQTLANLPVDSLDSLTLGLRYHYSNNIALKAEVSFLEGKLGDSAYFDRIDIRTQKPKAVLYQLAVEWIF
jgi:hypothetical protein